MPRFLVIPAFFVVSATSEAAEPTISYAFDVRPILSDKCFACHGPDGAKRDSGLRLDTAEGAYGPLKDTPGSAIVPGDPAKSVAWQRILSKDPEVVMPPPKSHLFLSDEEKNVLRKWIEQGGKYEPHWAFQPLPESVAIPAPKDTAWPQQNLDRFVLARLESEELAPSLSADPLRWLRRATIDVTGLPPTSEEIAACERNKRDGEPEERGGRLHGRIVQRSSARPKPRVIGRSRPPCDAGSAYHVPWRHNVPFNCSAQTAFLAR